MNRYGVKILAVLVVLLVMTVSGQAEICQTPDESLLQTSPELFERFDSLLDGVRDGTVGKAAALQELRALLPLVARQYRRSGSRLFRQESWVFPLAGYGPGAVPGRKGKGFVVTGYDFFSGNRHGGHPAYDIFIRDRNQDELDDRTQEPVAVLSMTGGVVVSVETAWEPGSKLRGGKYVWIYDPANDLLVYYAHNREVFVKQGDLVQPGSKLATVGRSGLNAAKRRSPTHLHMTVLRANQGNPQAVRFWKDLNRTRTVSCP